MSALASRDIWSWCACGLWKTERATEELPIRISASLTKTWHHIPELDVASASDDPPLAQFLSGVPGRSP